jgi:tetratricopeptide (TPR) repeat protein
VPRLRINAQLQGNASYAAGDYPGAIGSYTRAIQLDPSEPTYATNRALAYLKLQKCVPVFSHKVSAFNSDSLIRQDLPMPNGIVLLPSSFRKQAQKPFIGEVSLGRRWGRRTRPCLVSLPCPTGMTLSSSAFTMSAQILSSWIDVA